MIPARILTGTKQKRFAVPCCCVLRFATDDSKSGDCAQAQQRLQPAETPVCSADNGVRYPKAGWAEDKESTWSKR